MTGSGVLAIIQAGGAGNRMDVLTRERAKPALPVAGVYQLIDFSLSNLPTAGSPTCGSRSSTTARPWRSRSPTAVRGTSTGPAAGSG